MIMLRACQTGPNDIYPTSSEVLKKYQSSSIAWEVSMFVYIDTALVVNKRAPGGSGKRSESCCFKSMEPCTKGGS